MQWNHWALLVALIVLPYAGLRHRHFFFRFCLTLLAGIFWGALISYPIARYLGILGGPRVFFVVLPVAFAIAVWFWPRSRKVVEQHYE